MVALSSIFERLVLLEAEARCPPSKRGRPRELSDSEALSVFFKVLRTGMQWREADGDVHYTTLLRRMHVWSKNHVFDAAYTRALKTYKRLCPTTHYCVDSSYVKNAFGRECVGKNHTDRGRKALKLSVVVDQHGIPHGICCHPGNRPDVCLLQDTLRSMLVDVESRPLYADKGYDSRNNRKVCHAAGVQDRIFRRRTTATRRTHAKRIVVEHTFAWLKSYRRLLHFYDNTPVILRSFVVLALGNILGRRVDGVRRLFKFWGRVRRYTRTRGCKAGSTTSAPASWRRSR